MSDMAVRALISDVQEEIRAMAEQLVDERALADQLAAALGELRYRVGEIAVAGDIGLPGLTDRGIAVTVADAALAAWREARQS